MTHRLKMLSPGVCLVLAVSLSLCLSVARADVASIQAQMDTTIFDENEVGGDLSNGAGSYVFAGTNGPGGARRALIRFDVTSAVPAGSTVTAVVFSLRLSRSASLNQNVTIHKLTHEWGEAGSDAGGMEGAGTQAQTGDATWIYRFYESLSWATAGGDFVGLPSGTTAVGGPCLPENNQSAACIKYNWTGAGLVNDVQNWLDQPATNFGWILRGNEGTSGSAKRFDSRESSTASNRPLLRVIYDPPVSGAPGSVPDGGAIAGVPLELAKLPGQLQFSWSASCSATADNYEIYEGTIGNYYDHAPLTCTTLGSTGITITLPLSSHYYLVVPVAGTLEGGYGVDGDGSPRPAAAAACRLAAPSACP